MGRIRKIGSAHCNHSQILYQFLTFTQNLKRSLEVPKEIYQNPKAETCELEEIVCIRLYDDPYIQMTIDFNLNANVKKPRKKSSII